MEHGPFGEGPDIASAPVLVTVSGLYPCIQRQWGAKDQGYDSLFFLHLMLDVSGFRLKPAGLKGCAQDLW